MVDENPNQVKKVKVDGPAIYVKFPQEEIIGIIEDDKNVNHHVVVQIVLLTRDSHVKESLEQHASLIISEFLELLESQNYEELLTYDVKIELRENMLKHLKKSIPDYGYNVEAVLITKFLMD